MIEPALTPDEWKAALDNGPSIVRGDVQLSGMGGCAEIHVSTEGEEWGVRVDADNGSFALMALLNESLDYSDPRKITREAVIRMRDAVDVLISDHRLQKPGREEQLAHWDMAYRLADALVALLPPE